MACSGDISGSSKFSSGNAFDDKKGSIWSGRNGEPSQFSALGSNTKIVTLIIGGNDLGFAKVLTGCTGLASKFIGLSAQFERWPYTCIPTLNRARNLLAVDQSGTSEFERAMVDTYAQILVKAPNATLFVLEYPQLFTLNPAGRFCPLSNSIDAGIASIWPGLSNRDVLAINDLELQTNRAIGSAIETVNGSTGRAVLVADNASSVDGAQPCDTHGLYTADIQALAFKAPDRWERDLVRACWGQGGILPSCKLLDWLEGVIDPGSFHPKSSGQAKMAQALLKSIKNRVSRFNNHVVALTDGSSWLVDSSGNRHRIVSTDSFYVLTAKYGPALRPAGLLDLEGWSSLTVGSDAPDALYGPGLNNTIIRRNDGVSWVVINGVRHHIPDYPSDLCAQFVDHRTVSKTGLSFDLANTLPEDTSPATGPYACSLDNTVLRAADKPEPKPSYWYYGGLRHAIADGFTYSYAIHQARLVDVSTDAAIQLLRDGGTQPSKLRIEDIPANSIIIRNDNISWMVDGNKVRHAILYKQDGVCWRDKVGLPVSATNLTFDQAQTLPESPNPGTCIVPDPGQDAAVVKSNDGASYLVDSHNFRHWIPDTDTFAVLARRWKVYGPWPATDVAQLPVGDPQVPLLNPDTVNNTIIRRNDGVSWVVINGVRHVIPFGQDDVCWRDRVGLIVSKKDLTYAIANTLPEDLVNKAVCIIPGNDQGVIVTSSNGAVYFIDRTNTRHWIQNGETISALQHWGYRNLGTWPSDDVSKIPEGGWQPKAINPDHVRNTLVCASWGSCFKVDGNGALHGIPSYPDFVCWRYVGGLGQSMSGLNQDELNSLGGDQGGGGCGISGRILSTDTGASYFMDGQGTRRWIQDTESYWCYVNQGHSPFGPVPQGEANGIYESSNWMPRCLDPNRVKGHVVRISDGTSYYVDWYGWWHWIPSGGDFNCDVRNHGLLISDATWAEVNALRTGHDAGGNWGYCGI